MKELTSEELKQVQIDIMKYVHNFCEKNGIKYFICSGTLIGAARHKGFIPWDDDIDIMMPRKDYDRFVELFSKETNRYKVWAFNLQDEYPNPYAKVTDEMTYKKENIIGAIELGVDIDIFPIDDLPDDDEKVKDLFKVSRKYFDMLTLKQTTLSKHRSLLKNLTLIVGRVLLACYPTHTILKKIDKNAKRYLGCGGHRSADVVFCVAGLKEVHEKDYYSELIDMPFENEMFKAPKKYHEFLTARYGDYMKLPPIEQQVTHHSFVAYWKDPEREDHDIMSFQNIDATDFTI